MQPLITIKEHTILQSATAAVEISIDLGRSMSTVEVRDKVWTWQDRSYPLMQSCKDRTIYYWDEDSFQPVSRYSTSLIKLVPTEWGAPTFEIDGIKMLPTAQLSPYVDAEQKVNLIQPQGKVILDTCGGLGYFASWCLQNNAQRIQSYEKNPDVIWLRELNPWSPRADSRLSLTPGDVSQEIIHLPSASVDAILHDPPRFGIAGELYSQVFYDHLARVLRPRGKLFHYTGTPNRLTSGRDVPNEVAVRLRRAGFKANLQGDGVLAVKT